MSKMIRKTKTMVPLLTLALMGGVTIHLSGFGPFQDVVLGEELPIQEAPGTVTAPRPVAEPPRLLAAPDAVPQPGPSSPDLPPQAEPAAITEMGGVTERVVTSPVEEARTLLFNVPLLLSPLTPCPPTQGVRTVTTASDLIKELLDPAFTAGTIFIPSGVTIPLMIHAISRCIVV